MDLNVENIDQLLHKIKISKKIKIRRFISYASLIVLIFLYIAQIISLNKLILYGTIICVPMTILNYIDDINKNSNIRRVVTLGLLVIILALLGDFGGFLHYD